MCCNKIHSEWHQFAWHESGNGPISYNVRLFPATSEYFNSDQIKQITVKCAVLILCRPAHTVYKTFYHLIAVPITLFCDPDPSEVIKRNLMGIVLTPIYGLLLTLLAVVGVVLGIFGSERIYELRYHMGKIEQSLNWGIPHNDWTLAPCFQSGRLECIGELWGKERYGDTVYNSEDSYDEIGKANYARWQIRNGRERCAPLHTVRGLLKFWTRRRPAT